MEHKDAQAAYLAHNLAYSRPGPPPTKVTAQPKNNKGNNKDQDRPTFKGDPCGFCHTKLSDCGTAKAV